MILQGKIIDLVPLELEHCEELQKAGADRKIWEFFSKKPFTLLEFENFIKESISKGSEGCYAFSIKTKGGTIIGSTQLRNYNDIHKTIDSSFTWITPEYWGKMINGEVKLLILDFCFNVIKVRRVQYVLDEHNINSQRSLLKLGAVKEGIMRNYRLYENGLYKNSIILSHISDDWPLIKQKIINMLENKKKYPEKFWAGGFLYNPKTKEVFLHKRDGNTIFNPNALAFFGGLNENNESPKECFKRELFEEIGLDINMEEIIYLDDYLNIELNTYRYVFYVISDVKKEKLILGEGAGFEWFILDKVFSQKITEKTERDLRKFVETLNIVS
jgi:N-acetyltransferase